MEDKRMIADKLAELLKTTDAGRSLESITISDDEAYAHMIWDNGYAAKLDIEGASGIEMIRSICGWA